MMPHSHTQQQRPWHVSLHERAETFGSSVHDTCTHIIRGAGCVAEAIRIRVSRCPGLFSTPEVCMADEGAYHRPMFASVSRFARSAHEVVTGLAASPAEVKARLAGVPVYAVVNSKKEFILVSGDEDSSRQISLLFFNKSDAEGFQSTIRKENPKLGKTAQVLATSLEAVYELAISKNKEYAVANGIENVTFRFMPDSRQVVQALDLYRKAGIPKDGFVGVPLFQAEGLTVKGDAARYTPLFFSKDDLDVALRDSFLNVSNASIKELHQKIERAKKELEELQSAKGHESTDRSIQEARERIEKYAKRLEREEAQAQKEKKNYPRVDVGSFEDVLVKMQQDSKGEWSDVIFVPPNSLNHANTTA